MKTKTSNQSKSHLAVRAGRRKAKGTGQGWGLSRTKKQVKKIVRRADTVSQ